MRRQTAKKVLQPLILFHQHFYSIQQQVRERQQTNFLSWNGDPQALISAPYSLRMWCTESLFPPIFRRRHLVQRQCSHVVAIGDGRTVDDEEVRDLLLPKVVRPFRLLGPVGRGLKISHVRNPILIFSLVSSTPTTGDSHSNVSR